MYASSLSLQENARAGITPGSAPHRQRLTGGLQPIVGFTWIVSNLLRLRRGVFFVVVFRCWANENATDSTKLLILLAVIEFSGAANGLRTNSRSMGFFCAATAFRHRARVLPQRSPHSPFVLFVFFVAKTKPHLKSLTESEKNAEPSSENFSS